MLDMGIMLLHERVELGEEAGTAAVDIALSTALGDGTAVRRVIPEFDLHLNLAKSCSPTFLPARLDVALLLELRTACNALGEAIVFGLSVKPR
jgi:hypothetical protein